MCTSGKFKSIIDENPTEITVQCIEGHSIKYKQYAYEYDYFECDDTQRLKAARRAFRKIFVPKTRKYNRIGKLYIMFYKYIFNTHLIILTILVKNCWCMLNIQRLSSCFK